MLRYLIFSLILFLSIGCSQSKTKKIPGAYEAMNMMSFVRAYPNADIPPDGFYKGFEQHQKLKNKSEAKSFVDPWEDKGPKNTTGRTLTLAINPQDPNTVYAGSASGGLWRSRNLGLGESWEYMETGFPVLGVSDIEFVPGDSSIMFITTGEVYNYQYTGTDGAFRATRGSYGMGILKSTDGGATWKKSLDWSYENQRGAWMVKVSEVDHNLVFASTTDGIYRSEDQGESWEKVLDVILGIDVIAHPDNENLVLVSVGNFGSPGAGVYRSEDKGETWNFTDLKFASNFQGKILLAHAPSNPNKVYASVGNGFGAGDEASWLLSSTNFGSDWTVENATDYSRWQGWFSHDVDVDPRNEDYISVVGIDIWRSLKGGDDLFRMSEGGVTFGRPEIDQPDGPANYSHSDHHFVMYHPTIDDLILYANDGGLFLSYDNGESFRSANGGMQTTQFYNGFSVSQVSDDHVMGGLQDNSTSLYRGDGRWERVIGGDGSWTSTNPFAPNLIFGSAQYLNMRRSSNGGNSFENIRPPFQFDEDPLFIAPFALAPNNPTTLYAGGRYLYKSTDSGSSWEIMNGGATIGSNPAFAIDVSHQDENIVYIATAPTYNDSELLPPQVAVSKDGGESFDIISLDLPNRVPNDITVDPTNPAVAYVTISGFGTNHLYKTENYGADWKAIDNGLPDVPGNALAVDPAYPDQLYYGNDLGVYFSADGGNSWDVWGEGLRLATLVLDLKISKFDRSIWVATHGSGAYKRFLEPGVLSTEELEENELEILCYPNPVLDFLHVELLKELEEKHILKLFDINGRLVKTQSVNLGKNRIEVSDLPKGNYNLMINSGQKIFTQQIIKIGE